ncbi:MAG TPA: flavodoxin domain-containing protein, partial [Methanomicrobiales archaeon]|nr:flavodoxin domain-containing protein [Methanomicrobiales archaeon]
HGPLYDHPSLILDAYKKWASDAVENRVVIPYVSMHGTTEEMVRYLTDALIRRGVEVDPIDLSTDDTARLALAIVDPATMVIGTPTVLFGPHPKAVSALYVINALKPKVKHLSVIGSFGWGGATVQRVLDLLGHLKVEQLSPVYIKGSLKEKDYQDLDRLAEEIREKHANLGIA